MGNSSHNEAPGTAPGPSAPAVAHLLRREGVAGRDFCGTDNASTPGWGDESVRIVVRNFLAIGLATPGALPPWVWCGGGEARCRSNAAGGPRARRPANLGRPADGLVRRLIGGGRAYANEVQVPRDFLPLGSWDYARGRGWQVYPVALRVRRVRGLVGLGGRGYGGCGGRGRRQINDFALEIRRRSGPKPRTSSNEKGVLALWRPRPRCGPLILYI